MLGASSLSSLRLIFYRTKVVKAPLFERFVAPSDHIRRLISAQIHAAIHTIDEGHPLDVVSPLAYVVKISLTQQREFFGQDPSGPQQA